MAKAGRKPTGARLKKTKKKKLSGRQKQERTVKLGERKIKKIRARGGRAKNTLLSEKEVNVIKNKKAHKILIKNVLETPSNIFLARQNILIKGAVIETELGKAVITNRPSQEGNIQAKIIE